MATSSEDQLLTIAERLVRALKIASEIVYWEGQAVPDGAEAVRDFESWTQRHGVDDCLDPELPTNHVRCKTVRALVQTCLTLGLDVVDHSELSGHIQATHDDGMTVIVTVEVVK
jgi:hypothetical protein